jgi:hypothetical protein
MRLQLVRLLFWNRYSTEERVDLDVYEDETRKKDTASGGSLKMSKNNSNKVAPVDELENETKEKNLVDDTGDNGSRSKTIATTSTTMDSDAG